MTQTRLEAFKSATGSWDSFRSVRSVDPPTGDPATRLGVHVTAEELAVWRDRSVNGPYKSSNDVAQNSPGDWDRIVAHRNTYMAGSFPIWGGFTSKWSPQPTWNWHIYLECAAFYHLVKNDTSARDQVKADLLAQAAAVNFTDSIYDGTANDLIQWIFEWGHVIHHAYDYLLAADADYGTSTFTSAELATLDTWFYRFADWCRVNTWWLLGDSFGDFPNDVLYWNANGTVGLVPTQIHRGYNNRRAGALAFYASVAQHLDSVGYVGAGTYSVTQMISDAKTSFQNFLKYGVFPQGAMGDFHRSSGTLAERGWAYAMSNLLWLTIVADLFARHGDTSLWTYETTEGTADGGPDTSAGAPTWPGFESGKSLLFCQTFMLGYMNDAYQRYGHSTISDEYRIDGREPRTSPRWSAVHHIICAVNYYHRDSYVRAGAERLLPNMVGYPSTPATWSGVVPSAYNAAVFPGVMFMFARLEDVTDPYGVL